MREIDPEAYCHRAHQQRYQKFQLALTISVGQQQYERIKPGQTAPYPEWDIEQYLPSNCSSQDLLDVSPDDCKLNHHIDKERSTIRELSPAYLC
mmetsp:Transcript_7626/g.13252  ORF Transcript_7626/g.13252 Transcript_7626/m.13252 type:complete len:94 (-) Transcript_7626:319-600(-)